MSIKNQILGLALFSFISMAGADEYNGTVINQSTLEPVKGVIVSLGYSQLRTRTDNEGKFSLNTEVSVLRRLKKSSSFKLFWNNRSGIVEFLNISDIKKIAIFDLKGSSVFKADITSKCTKIKVPILARGIYLLRLSGRNGTLHSFKMNTVGSAALFTINSNINSIKKTSVPEQPKLLFRHDDYFPADIIVNDSLMNLVVKMKKDPRSVVFDQQKVHSFNFTLTTEDSIYMERYARDENYIPAQLSYNDQSIGKVGLRYKGSTYSLPNCFDTNGNRYDKPECQKISFKVKFNEYIDTLRLYDMKALNLHAMSADGSKMRDMIGYQFFRDMGIYSPRTSYVQIYINGQLQGLYVAVEAIDGRFTKSRWPEFGDGNLYKEAWPKISDPDYYKDQLETNEDPEDSADVSAMVNLFNAIDSSTPATFSKNVGSFIDFKYLAKYLAVDRAIKNWDGFTGWYSDEGWTGNHNYFFYEEENEGGKIWLIPWDLDNTFWRNDPYIDDADIPNWNEKPQSCEPMDAFGGNSHIIPSNCDKFTSLVADNYWNDFVSAGDELLTKVFIPDVIYSKIDKYSELIDSIILKDPRVNYNVWENEVSTLKKNLKALHLQFYNYIHQIPEIIDTSDYSTPFEGEGYLLVDRVNNFEFVPDGDEFPFGYVFYSDGSTGKLVHTTENPIWGTADLLYSFSFSKLEDETSYSEWMKFIVQSKISNIERCKEIRVNLSSDQQRNLWVSLRSSVDEQYGWSIYVNKQQKLYSLKIDEISYPTWVSTGDPQLLQSVLKSFSGLGFSPSGLFDSQGELVNNPDTGYIRVDNIKFVF